MSVNGKRERQDQPQGHDLEDAPREVYGEVLHEVPVPFHQPSCNFYWTNS